MQKHNSSFKREIGLYSLIAYYFSTVVGAGIFIVPVITAKKAGPASIISWAIALFSTIPFALIFAHISSRYKISGCIQKFLEDSGGAKFGRSVALYLTIAAMIGNTLLAIAASNYVLQVFDLESSYASVFAVSSVLLFLPTIFNLFEIGVSSKIQTTSLIILVVMVEIVIILALPNANFENFTPFIPNGIESVYAGAILCFYSLIGWENVDAMAGEVKNANTNYKRGIKYAISIIALFYLSIVFTTIAVIDTNTVNADISILALLLTTVFDERIAKVATLFSITLILLGLNAWTLGSSRLLFALAKDNVIPRKFALINSRMLPSNAILLQFSSCLFISFLIMMFSLNIDYILEIASIAYLLLYTIIFFCGIKSFTTKRLKLLSFCAMSVTFFFINEGESEVLSVVTSLLTCCFLYVYFIAGRSFYNSNSKVV